ncbi:MAG: RadC family protein [Telluria sp.]
MKNEVREAVTAYAGHASDDAVIACALNLLSRRMKRPGAAMSSPNVVKQYLQLKIGTLEQETFVVLFLDVKNRLVACETLFTGTLTHTSVYPREVVKRALHHNCASVMLAHNHPSGSPEPSEADLLLTRTLVQTLALVDVRVLDHFVATHDGAHSFAEHGQI